jgi:hypothetical protein
MQLPHFILWAWRRIPMFLQGLSEIPKNSQIELKLNDRAVVDAGLQFLSTTIGF